MEGWRLTFSAFVGAFGLDPGPSTVHGDEDAMSSVDAAIGAAGRLGALAAECTDVSAVLAWAERVDPRPETLVACLQVLGRPVDADALLAARLDGADGATTSRLLSLQEWFRSLEPIGSRRRRVR